MILLLQIYMKWFQHAAARRRLVNQSQQLVMLQLFQHAAARRRLVNWIRPNFQAVRCFNTQPPEGGWFVQSTNQLS